MAPELQEFLAVILDRDADETRTVQAYEQYLRACGLDHFTLAFGLNRADQIPEVLRIWTSLSDAWMEEYYASDYSTHDYVVKRAGAAFEGDRTVAAFGWGRHVADLPDVTPQTRQVLRGVDDAGLGAAMSFVGKVPMGAGERLFCVSFGCDGRSMEATRDLIEARRNELLVASFAMAPRLTPALERSLEGIDRDLTGRERDVLARFAQGLRPDRIANSLGVSKRTVDMHAANARRKLKAQTLAEATARAVRCGLI